MATPVATPAGWRPLGALRAGDAVLTAGEGPRAIRDIQRAVAPASLLVPPRALENREALILLPGQPVLIEADLADVLYGDPLALIPAAALIGWRGIVAQPTDCAGLSLSFDAPQIIYASRALLLPCSGADGAGISDPPAYPLSQARHLVACLMAEDLGGALRAARTPYAAA